jgi:hypothetical protein
MLLQKGLAIFHNGALLTRQGYACGVSARVFSPRFREVWAVRAISAALFNRRARVSTHETGVAEPRQFTRFKPADGRHFMGGSDARVIMGDDEASLIRLWREKRGEIEPEDLSGNLIVQLGLVTEELNRAWYQRNSGLPIKDRPEAGTASRSSMDGRNPGRDCRTDGLSLHKCVHWSLEHRIRLGDEVIIYPTREHGPRKLLSEL